MDPLERKDEDNERKPSYYRGFFDAEKRREVINHDPTLGQAIFGAFLGALPIALLIYFVSRSYARGSEIMNGKGRGDMMEQMRKSMQQMMNPMGNRDFKVSVKNTKFKDVIGIPEALEEVQQYVNFLKTPEKFTRLGARLPKGCILTGQPGTGKTLLAKAVAGEADVPFFNCSGADFIEVYAGSGPKRVRDLFAEAKKESPSVIFIDEIDAVGSRSNGNGPLGLSGEENRTINQLLAELDGLKANEAVVVFAATNFVDSLDKALLREGRFDRKVELPMPDKEAREDLFKFYLDRVTTSDAPTLSKKLAELTPGVSPATISAIVNEAALGAAVKEKPAVQLTDLLPAIDDVLVGKKHRNRMSSTAAERVALHECGHTLVAWLLSEQSDVIKVSIIPRGPAAGFTQQVGREVLDMATAYSMFTDICVMLGGRLAELTQHTNLTTGAQDDYQRATQTAINQFLAFGMSQRVGLLSYEPQRLTEGRMYQKHSEAAQHVAEKEASLLVAVAHQFVQTLLKKHEAELKTLAQELTEKKELLKDDLIRILGPRSKYSVELDAESRVALDRFIKASESKRTSASNSREELSKEPKII